MPMRTIDRPIARRIGRCAGRCRASWAASRSAMPRARRSAWMTRASSYWLFMKIGSFRISDWLELRRSRAASCRSIRFIGLLRLFVVVVERATGVGHERRLEGGRLVVPFGDQQLQPDRRRLDDLAAVVQDR